MELNLLDPHKNQELLTWYDTITIQNYFINKNNIAIQNDELATVTPSSGILSEIFLQHIENLHITHLTQKRNILK